jgi:hypothetical protein
MSHVVHLVLVVRIVSTCVRISSRPSRLVLGPTQTITQWVLMAVSPGAKRLGPETDHSTSLIAEVKIAWSFTPTLHDVVLN